LKTAGRAVWALNAHHIELDNRVRRCRRVHE
jgi:hypothetical protein